MMTNHIASTSRWRLRAGMLGHLAGRALDHLRQAFSGFIAPELAAEAVCRSAQRTVALLPAPAPAVEPEIVGAPEGSPQAGLREAEPVAAILTPIAVAAETTEAASLPVEVMTPGSQPGPSSQPGVANHARALVETIEDPPAGSAVAEPVAALSPDGLKRPGQAPHQAAIPIAVVQAQAEPLSLRRTGARPLRKVEAGHSAPAVEGPPSVPVVAKPVAAPTPTEVAAEGGTTAPAPVFAPEDRHTTKARQGSAMRGGRRTKMADEPMAGLAPAQPAAALSSGAEKRVGRERNRASAPLAFPEAQAEPASLRRAVSRQRRQASAVAADRATDSEGKSINSNVVAR